MIKNVIIITSGLQPDHCLNGLEFRLLDRMIKEVVAMGKNPVLVIGDSGEEILRHCVQTEACDLVFDPNFSGDIFSSIHAGLEVSPAAALIWPYSFSSVAPTVWSTLESCYFPIQFDKKINRIEIQTNGADSQNLPFIVTASGRQYYKSLSAQSSWIDLSNSGLFVCPEEPHVDTPNEIG